MAQISLFNIIVGFSARVAFPGDLNGNGVADLIDVNLACAQGGDIAVLLRQLQTLPGDANLDQAVNFTDFLVVSTNFGSSGRYSDGDFDCDGRVQFTDFLLLSANFGFGGRVAANAPEPNGMGWIGMGLVFCCRGKRRTR